ncbi:hypothetical protein BTA51_09990 [Hahella sp. CCB-MM4]|uniref:DUF2868 domain-containing protein n=1 Tax=Hahella sp. (strain CCB-MM4) TaxID=1926491 RepID=UPI000B9ABCD8|nr:DUF2868 domain-containing protein [Hahella sp. CCB-MM4]OZG73354.1 hypothetical protein BTA51_09990 [Hahella sp. CCB-MM4]
MNPTFKQKLYSEVLRNIETDEPLKGSQLIEQRYSGQDLSLLEKILQRGVTLVREYKLESVIQRTLSRIQFVTVGMTVLFFLLGGLASMQAFQQSQTGVVNFYWLVTVLLGFDFLALFIWGVSMTVAAISGTSMRGPGLWVQRLVIRYFPGKAGEAGKAGEISAAQAVFSVVFSGAIGRWWLSRASHSFWLAYLCGGLLTILFMLSTRQFDFVWETTILTNQTFISVTEGLSVIPSWIGFSVPSAEQISASQLSLFDVGRGDSLRQVWASLLIGAMIVYGILPRLLLLVVSHLMISWQQNRFRLDLTRPYYIGLRERLMPAASQFGIVDPDLKKKGSTANSESVRTDIRLPEGALYAGIELNQDQPWPPAGILAEDDLGRIEDRESQERLLRRLAASGAKDLVAVVPVRRSPDRGLERLFAEIKKHTRGRLFIALSEASEKPKPMVSSNHQQPNLSRQSDWYRLAMRVGIEADAIVKMEYSGTTEQSSATSRAVRNG